MIREVSRTAAHLRRHADIMSRSLFDTTSPSVPSLGRKAALATAVPFGDGLALTAPERSAEDRHQQQADQADARQQARACGTALSGVAEQRRIHPEVSG